MLSHKSILGKLCSIQRVPFVVFGNLLYQGCPLWTTFPSCAEFKWTLGNLGLNLWADDTSSRIGHGCQKVSRGSSLRTYKPYPLKVLLCSVFSPKVDLIALVKYANFVEYLSYN